MNRLIETLRRPGTKRSTAPSSGVVEVPGGWPLIGHAFAFGRNPDAFMRRWREALGDEFSIRLPGGRRIFLCNPFDPPGIFREKRLGFHEMGVAIGGRVFGFDIERAGRHDIESMIPMLGRDMRGVELQAMSERMQVLFVRRLFGELGTTGPRTVSLLRLLTEHFFAAGLDAFFGEGMYTPELFDQYERIDRYFAWVAAGLPAAFVPGFTRAATDLARRAQIDFPHRAAAIDHRKRMCREIGIEPEQLGRHNASIIWALQVNTVAAAFWTVRFILGDPTARRAITEEVRGLANVSPTPADVKPFPRDTLRRMVLLDSATEEAMRLTAGPLVMRRAMENFVLELDSGRRISLQRGEEIFIYPRLQQIDREIFRDPYTFDYHRFVDDHGRPVRFFRRGRRVTTPTLPFGGGVSMCPGRHFAKNEIKILVATLLLWLDSELTSPMLPAMDFSRIGLGILPPKQDVELRVELRSGT